jgi:hypothetical protein
MVDILAAVLGYVVTLGIIWLRLATSAFAICASVTFLWDLKQWPWFQEQECGYVMPQIHKHHKIRF